MEFSFYLGAFCAVIALLMELTTRRLEKSPPKREPSGEEKKEDQIRAAAVARAAEEQAEADARDLLRQRVNAHLDELWKQRQARESR